MLESMTMAWVLMAAMAMGIALAVFVATVLFRRRALRSSHKTEPHKLDVAVEPSPSSVVPRSLDKPLVRDVDIPVIVTRLALDNIRSFSRLDLHFAPPPASTNTGQWALILGDNGVGKSTILRGLVLALADPDVATALLQTQKSPAPLIRRGCQEGTIAITINSNLSYEVRLSSGSGSERLQLLQVAEERPALFAYGPLRGSALGGAARQVSFSAVDPVATLFDESAQLIHAETWLAQRKLAALQTRGGPDEAFFEAVIKTLAKLGAGAAANSSPESVNSRPRTTCRRYACC